MPQRFRDDSISTSKLDELLGKHVEKSRLMERAIDLNYIENNSSEIDPRDPAHCEFEDTCHATKFNRGACPCELFK